MNYFVIASDGQKYGPADISTLNDWAQQNRLQRDSMLEDAVTGARVQASTVAGINFPVAAPTPNFTQAPSYPQGGFGAIDNGSEDIKKAWIFGTIGLFCCPIVFSVIGIVNAVNAQKKGHPQGTAAMIYCIVTLALGIGVNAFLRFNMLNNR